MAPFWQSRFLQFVSFLCKHAGQEAFGGFFSLSGRPFQKEKPPPVIGYESVTMRFYLATLTYSTT